MTYLIFDAGEQRGPYTKRQILKMWENGELTAAGFIWRKELDAWKPLVEFCEPTEESGPPLPIAPLPRPALRQAPPPLPKAAPPSECYLGPPPKVIQTGEFKKKAERPPPLPLAPPTQFEKKMEAHAQRQEYRFELMIQKDRVEITSRYVRYNDVSIPADEITGVRYGIYKHYTNGAQNDCSYLIGLSSFRGVEIKIECKRWFRNESLAVSDYEAIVNALLASVISPLVFRLSTAAVASGIKLGSGVMSAEGMTLNKFGFFKGQDVFVPYESILFSYGNGYLFIGKGIDGYLASYL